MDQINKVFFIHLRIQDLLEYNFSDYIYLEFRNFIQPFIKFQVLNYVF